ncbi:MAG: DNA-binding protein, partial [Deltaproteobacteria bacterium]|nr:DNA-binding protein [Deltaproteobacteria bacterium]
MENSSAGKNLNFRIARRLEEVAQILESQGGNPFRVQAYRHAADTLRHLTRPAEEILRQEGEPGLRKLPGIGERLARSIATLLITGRLPMLDRLRGESESGALFASVPGIGKSLAARLHRELGIDTLEQLESAAHDGRLRAISGIGDKRVAGIIDSLFARLGRVRPIRAVQKTTEPTIAEIFDVDREYRDKATAGTLPTITPRRFNPNREAWLPILHSKRGERHYTAIFSNTARAHQMEKTRDWVVIYYDGRDGERQCTVITSERGPLIGERIVRGRESECLQYYRQARVYSV